MGQKRMSIHNEEERRTHIYKLVSNARAIISYQVGLPVGCLRMARLLSSLQPLGSFEYPVFGEYLLEVQNLPIGSERLHWARDALRKVDERLDKTNAKFRERVFESCHDIIDAFATD
jgi:hypothetical protein